MDSLLSSTGKWEFKTQVLQQWPVGQRDVFRSCESSSDVKEANPFKQELTCLKLLITGASDQTLQKFFRQIQGQDNTLPVPKNLRHFGKLPDQLRQRIENTRCTDPMSDVTKLVMSLGFEPLGGTSDLEKE